MQGAGCVRGAWILHEYHKCRAFCNNHLPLTVILKPKEEKLLLLSQHNHDSSFREKRGQLRASVSKTSDKRLWTHIFWATALATWAFEKSITPHLVYPASTINKESVKKAMVIEHSWSVTQSGWIMMLIINYYGRGRKGRLKLKAKPEFIRHVVNVE